MPGKNRPSHTPEGVRARSKRSLKRKRAARQGPYGCFYCGNRFATERGQHIHEWYCADTMVGL